MMGLDQYESADRQCDGSVAVRDAAAYKLIPPNLFNFHSDDADILGWLLPFYAAGSVQTPPELVYSFDGAYVSEHGYVFTRASELVAFSGNDAVQVSLNDLRAAAGQPVDQVPGAAAFIFKAGRSNYMHFLVEMLPKLENLSHLPDRHITLLVPSLPAPFLAALRDVILPIYGDRFSIRPMTAPVAQVERLLYPSPVSLHNRRRSGTLRLFVDRLKAFHAVDSSPARRLYVGRQAATQRRLLNEADIIPLFTERGFEVVAAEALTFADQMRLFAQASVMAGPLGAGLFNIVYADPAATLLVLDPGIYDIAFFDVASLFGIKTSILFTEAIQRLTLERQVRDFTVDPALLAGVMGSLRL